MILISGSNGLLGTSLKNYFNSKKINFYTIGEKNCNFNGDIKNNSFVEKTIKNLKPKIFVNLAAITDVDHCEQNQELAFKINTEFPEVVAKTLKLSSISYYIIQISSDQVYNDKGPHKEDKTNPQNQYSKTKIEAEKILSNYNSISLRTNFFGRSENLNKQSITDKIYQSCLNKSEFNIFDDVYFSPVSFRTIFNVIHTLIEKKICGIYNLGTKEGMSKKEFALHFCKCLNLETKNIIGNSLKDVNLVANRPIDMRLDSTKLEKDLKIKMLNLKDEINKVKSEYII